LLSHSPSLPPTTLASRSDSISLDVNTLPDMSCLGRFWGVVLQGDLKYVVPHNIALPHHRTATDAPGSSGNTDSRSGQGETLPRPDRVSRGPDSAALLDLDWAVRLGLRGRRLGGARQRNAGGNQAFN